MGNKRGGLMSTYEKYKIFSQKYEEKVKKSRKKNNKGGLMSTKAKYVELIESIVGGDHLDEETLMMLMVDNGFDNHAIVFHLGHKYIDETSVENYRKELQSFPGK